MKCTKCNSNLIISYDEINSNLILECESCNDISDINKLKPVEILSIVNQGYYTKEVKKLSLKENNSVNFVLELIRKHYLYKISQINVD